MKRKRGTSLERFEAKYIPEPNSGCWLWLASLGSNGYGQIMMPGGRPVGAHVLSYKLFKGKIKKGLDVRHTCDVRWCVNPDHLLLGTRQQNMADCERRGRIARGFKLPHTRLSKEQVHAIISDPRLYREIAFDYKIHSSYVSMIKNKLRRFR